MKPSQVAESLKFLIPLARPAFIWGPPGVGKSQVVAQAAAALGRKLVDVRAVLLDPVDLRGLPHVNGDGRAHWAVPDFLPRDGSGVLFFDELPNAPASVQSAILQLTLDRRLGEYLLPEGWSVLAAGNRETDRAGAARLISSLALRFVHVDFETDLDDWTRWALGAGIETALIAFLRFRPALLHSFDPSRKSSPNQRGWAFVSQMMQAGFPSPAVELDLISGTVGEGAAGELIAFLKVWRTMPNPDGVLLNPGSAPIPAEKEPATLYALCTALAARATSGNFDRVVTYANRLPSEFSTLLVKLAVGRDESVKSTRAFIDWASKNANVLV